jgi:hypothetical protein
MRGSLMRLMALATLIWGFSLPALAQTAGEPMRFSAWAVNMSNMATGANAIVEIVVDRWSTEAEREALIKTFVEKGPEKLLSALQKNKKVGYIRYPSSMAKYWGMSALGYDLRFARQVPGEDGGRRIILATDRYIGYAEAVNRPRTIDYPFTLIEIRLNKENEGEGKMSIATKIKLNEKEKVVELENYSSEPVRLQNLKAEKK